MNAPVAACAAISPKNFLDGYEQLDAELTSLAWTPGDGAVLAELAKSLWDEPAKVWDYDATYRQAQRTVLDESFQAHLQTDAERLGHIDCLLRQLGGQAALSEQLAAGMRPAAWKGVVDAARREEGVVTDELYARGWALEVIQTMVDVLPGDYLAQIATAFDGPIHRWICEAVGDSSDRVKQGRFLAVMLPAVPPVCGTPPSADLARTIAKLDSPEEFDDVMAETRRLLPQYRLIELAEQNRPVWNTLLTMAARHSSDDGLRQELATAFRLGYSEPYGFDRPLPQSLQTLEPPRTGKRPGDKS